MSNFIFKTWESDFFNRSIFDFDLNFKFDINVGEEDFWPKNSLITAKVKSFDYFSLNLVNSLKFDFCEGEVVFEKDIFNVIPLYQDEDFSKYLAKGDSIEELKTIVNGLYLNSRFRDPWFTLFERESFYKLWIENAVLSKFDDCCLILKDGSSIAGFVTLRIRNNKGIIGLIGVKSAYQGQGIGKKLLQLVDKYCASNADAVKLYHKNGYNLSNISYWFYKKV
ncbi:GNAT family N-acetyltransferase [Marinomonas sp.]|uniref:GNAT family N-acetyltransferase n=1 Tax=Marinomonas sp. TaxID=1904862 RepID=UPI003BAB1977